MSNPIITVEELHEMLATGKAVTMLDIRPKAQREEWQIAGSQFVDAYNHLREGDYSALDAIDIPEGTLAVTICGAGGLSLIAAAALIKRGVHALSLEGGMKAWESKFGRN
ncbi:MAG: hypothetical protein JO154_04300 [Chitinophaga sp.]|uniref:rhodanese-like domain-containing protein n=1 Tax=Chitinophaga sp. TaxID=1869181 RepID=UPI0025B98EF6|nr:rhodanese-like domain-containing protein [Chitinophaga sp.]MBV8251808.1 hypothetical protein [Chitinophaga sp.]